MNLTDKIVLVTGAGSGIGEEIVRLFAEEGARVAAAGRRMERLKAARERAGAASGRVFPFAADVSDRKAVEELFAQIRRELGEVEVLVNNAGVNVPRRSLEQLTPEDFERVVQVNLNGAFYCIYEALPAMRTRAQGLIINISSIAGLRASRLGGAAYSASKFGLTSLSQTVGLEERANGIRSCLICPGEVNTPILEDRPEIPSSEKRQRMLQPEDVARAALFIASLPPRATVPEMVIAPSDQAFS